MADTIVDIGGLLMRRESVNRELSPVGFVDGRDFPPTSKGATNQPCSGRPVAVVAGNFGQPDIGIHRPGHAMRILAPVLAHPGWIIGNTAGIGLRRFRERWSQKQDAVCPFEFTEPVFECREPALE